MGFEESLSITNVEIQKLPWPASLGKNIDISVLRLDLIHPVVSGNKWYKLKFFLAKSHLEGKTGLVTFGGAYSNHLLATAFAGRTQGLKTAGIIRGEKPQRLSPTLTDCADLGMELHFVDRQQYSRKKDLEAHSGQLFPNYCLIPEGGKGPLGITGAATILDDFDTSGYSHICCSVGTGTMMAGLATKARQGQVLIGMPALKVNAADPLYEFVLRLSSAGKIVICYDYHLGGYAKTPDFLPGFMNQLYQDFGIPTDQVYTAKLFFGVLDLIQKDYFPKHSRILIIHSGGLQGNRSLPEKTLQFQ